MPVSSPEDTHVSSDHRGARPFLAVGGFAGSEAVMCSLACNCGGSVPCIADSILAQHDARPSCAPLGEDDADPPADTMRAMSGRSLTVMTRTARLAVATGSAQLGVNFTTPATLNTGAGPNSDNDDHPQVATNPKSNSVAVRVSNEFKIAGETGYGSDNFVSDPRISGQRGLRQLR